MSDPAMDAVSTQAQPGTPPLHVAAVRDGTVVAFIDDLRTLVLERSLAATLAGHDSDDGVMGALSADAATLGAWRGWSGDGRMFLETLGHGEPIDRALSPYKSLVVEFVAWVSKWQAAMHRGALEELADLQRGHRGAEPVRDPGSVDREATVPESWLATLEYIRAS